MGLEIFIYGVDRIPEEEQAKIPEILTTEWCDESPYEVFYLIDGTDEDRKSIEQALPYCVKRQRVLKCFRRKEFCVDYNIPEDATRGDDEYPEEGILRVSFCYGGEWKSIDIQEEEYRKKYYYEELTPCWVIDEYEVGYFYKDFDLRRRFWENREDMQHEGYTKLRDEDLAIFRDAAEEDDKEYFDDDYDAWLYFESY